MATDRQAWRPDWGVPPGEILVEALADRGMSQAELARRTNRPLKTINEIVKGKAAITPETALQLELVLGVPASLWSNLERIYREYLARVQANQELEREAGWVQQFPISEMVRRGVLGRASSAAAQLTELLRFFAVSSPTAWEREWKGAAASFRQSPAFTASPEAISVWLRLGEMEAERLECAPFDIEKLRHALPAIRRLTRKNPLAFWTELVDMLRGCGVALVLTRELPGTHLSGATRWLSPSEVLVQLSLRHRSDDQFWFALFHELGHVLRSGRRRAYLDSLAEPAQFDQDEAQADEFARDQLIPPEDYQRILQMSRFTPDTILEVAAQSGVAPGIIVGRLQRDQRIGKSSMNFLKQQFHWPDEAYR